jgi:hypothetical protein
MAAAYGLDTLDPQLSTRRLRVLLDALPPYARRGGMQWSTEAELLAHLTDHVANLTWVTLRANGAGSAPQPQPIKRPDEPRAAPRGNAHADSPDRSASWSEAISKLAGMPGVAVSDG